MPLLKSALAGFCLGAASTKAQEGKIGEAIALATAGAIIWENRHKPLAETISQLTRGGEKREAEKQGV